MLTNILVVEDDRKTRFDINQTISKMDLDSQIYQATNGIEGLEILKQHAIDLLLTGIDMPVMNGLEMLGQIRSDPVFRDVPTIVLSSRQDAKFLKAITGSGLGYLHKPFSYGELRKRILNFKNEVLSHVEKT